jgi:hypothetical protein
LDNLAAAARPGLCGGAGPRGGGVSELEAGTVSPPSPGCGPSVFDGGAAKGRGLGASLSNKVLDKLGLGAPAAQLKGAPPGGLPPLRTRFVVVPAPPSAKVTPSIYSSL